MNLSKQLLILARRLGKENLEQALLTDRRELADWFKENAYDLADLALEMIFDPSLKRKLIKRIEEALQEISS